MKIINFYETYKLREIFWKFSNLVEKFTVAAKGILSGERSGHLKTIKRPPKGVGGAKAPRTVAKFHFLKRFKVFENEFIFQKCQHVNMLRPSNPIYTKSGIMSVCLGRLPANFRGKIRVARGNFSEKSQKFLVP